MLISFLETPYHHRTVRMNKVPDRNWNILGKYNSNLDLYTKTSLHFDHFMNNPSLVTVFHKN